MQDSEKDHKKQDHHWQMIRKKFDHWIESNPNLGISYSTAWVIFHVGFEMGEKYESQFGSRRTRKKKEK